MQIFVIMNSVIIYSIITILLFIAELIYFRIADHFNIIDRPNERSSHTQVVLRGGGVIFTLSLWIWSCWQGFEYPWLLAGVTLAAVVSFIDDIHTLPVKLRLFVHFLAVAMIFMDIRFTHLEMWWVVIIAAIMCAFMVNVYNFMDGINGMTGGYSLAVLIPLYLKNKELIIETGNGFVDSSMLVVLGLSLLVFCYFNFRAKAKCFAGDVGSIGMALILIFCIGKLVLLTEDMTWLIFLAVYVVDGVLTIIHRLMLHENIGESHRKHAYQLMANELKMEHVVVSFIYSYLQLGISLMMVYVIPNSVLAHWVYAVVIVVVLALSYCIFMNRYYHLHENYLMEISLNRKME